MNLFFRKWTFFSIGFLMLCFPFLSEAADFNCQDPVMKVSELRPGMRGEARTVLKGQKVEAFPVTILSVVPKKGIPRHLILIRAEGPLIEKTGGIAAGMSGSPVYVSGKLIGAIGYGWNFSDHRLGLVTPIEDMKAVFNWKDRIPPFFRAPRQEPETVSSDVASADHSSDVTSSDEVPPVSGDSMDETPPMEVLLADGMSPRAVESLSREIRQKILALGGGIGDEVPPVKKASRLKPGEAVGVMLAWGDVNIGATGTLTALSNDGRFIAFAHPFLNNGAVAYPLTEAWVHEVIPSVESPFKLGSPLSIIGTVTQDRPQAIGGKLNVYPPSYDFTVRFDDVDNKAKQTKRFHVALAPFLLSRLAPEALTGLLDDLWGRIGAGTARLDLSVTGPNLPGGWRRNNLFFSDKDLTKEVLKELKELMETFALNPFTEIAPLGFRLDLEMTSEPRILLIEDVKLDKKTIKAGEKLNVEVRLRPYRKDPFTRTFELTVPRDASGRSMVVVRGGGINEPGQDSITEGKTTIRDFPSLLKELSVRETNNQVVVEILTPGVEKAKSSVQKGKSEEPGDETPELLSEITEKKLKEGSMKIYNTNFYVDGLQQREISVGTESGEE
jgi:hypothetical protein